MRESLPKGNVLRIEKTSMHDGDGLRTVIFLKGCPLRCVWCSTPESLKAQPERGLARDKCTGCRNCISVCPENALVFADGNIEIDRGLCTGCFSCARSCSVSAIKEYGMCMTANEVLHEIAKDEVFYYHSGGGVTISGGEPLEQSDFVGRILEGCRDASIHRALETSFFAPWERIEPLLPLLNLLHVDLKHANAVEHKKLVGVDNVLIMENIRRADASPYEFDFVIRTPLIPDINDDEMALHEAAVFVAGLKKLRFMEFLAYHRLGTDTYRILDREYPLHEILTPDADYMLAKARFFQSIAKVPVRINGHEI